MSTYYCLIAGLPDVTLDDSKLSYTVADFKTAIYPDLSASDKKLIDLFYLKFDSASLIHLLNDEEAETDSGEEVLLEDRLTALYYAYALKNSNKFVASWFTFNLHLNNILVALTARTYKWDVRRHIIGDTEVCEALRTSAARDFGLSGEVEYFDTLLKIQETQGLLEREKKLDQLRWDWLEEATFFHYFTIERVFAFLLKLEMIERWLALDKERGAQLFRRMIDNLKNEVRIPAEFK